jgi:hypothetical protein
MGWFFGSKLHLVFNQLNQLVALKITAGNVADTKVVPSLTKTLVSKLFGDKGYIGKNLADQLLRRGLALFTRVRKNMKSLPLSMTIKCCSTPATWPKPSLATLRLSLLSISPNIDPRLMLFCTFLHSEQPRRAPEVDRKCSTILAGGQRTCARVRLRIRPLRSFV